MKIRDLLVLYLVTDSGETVDATKVKTVFDNLEKGISIYAKYKQMFNFEGELQGDFRNKLEKSTVVSTSQMNHWPAFATDDEPKSINIFHSRFSSCKILAHLFSSMMLFKWLEKCKA